MKYQIIFDKKAEKQMQKLKKDKKTLSKILEIIETLEMDPYSTTHKFERLKENYSGFCSKRIDKKNRLIYKVEDEKIIVLVVSVLGHYE
jgi:toxin YoeB